MHGFLQPVAIFPLTQASRADVCGASVRGDVVHGERVQLRRNVRSRRSGPMDKPATIRDARRAHTSADVRFGSANGLRDATYQQTDRCAKAAVWRSTTCWPGPGFPPPAANRT